MPRLLLALAAGLLALHIGADQLEPGGHFVTLLAEWFQPVAFFGSGVAVLIRVAMRRSGLPWALLGCGLILYASGNVYYNLATRAGEAPGFPSAADVLWLSIYPLAFAALMLLARGRLKQAGVAVWLDGLIGGSVVAAVVAAVVFDPVFDIQIADGTATMARLAYPVADLISVGIVIAVWSMAGSRLHRFWALLGVGFGLLALADSVYVVQAARGEWVPGNALDYPYAIATMLIALAAWTERPHSRAPGDLVGMRVGLPVFCGLVALVLTSLAVIVGLNPLATALSLMTMLAVVMRLGSTLTRMNRQSRELAALAATDPLTGLANHRTVHERLARELKRARGLVTPVAVVALDIDHFKRLNDTYGHAEGDAALQAIARVLSEQVADAQLVGRVGGEEFALVLPAMDSDDAYAVAERCRAALSSMSLHGEGVSCSAGVASYPADDPTGARLLELADGALYWAKRSGRAQTRRFDPREVILLSGAEQRTQVQAVLDAKGALTPVFQPIVELATGRVAGYEALTRFHQAEPARSPDLWFAQARRCGLGPALEARALAVALAVPDRPAGTFLSLNVSPAALVSAEVAAVLPDDLSELVIELTEDEIFSSDTALDAELDALRARGARIAVDDAGAGYAGLQQLVRLKPDIVKLDRSLITGMDMDASKMALIEALARFSTTTGAAVLGEGIETIAELRMLARADATYAQGYALARPGPAWPAVADDIASNTTSEVSMGLRLAGATAEFDRPLTLGEVADTLSRVRTRAELNAAVPLIERLLHAEEVTASRVIPGERCVQSMTDHEGEEPGQRYSYDDYPTTEHVIVAQVLGQLIAGDPASDPAELALLTDQGFAALLMAPITFRGETVGLLEIYRRASRPWTSAEIDHAWLLAQSLGAAIRIPDGDALPWSPAGFGAGAERPAG